MAQRTANEIAKLFVENRINSFKFMYEAPSAIVNYGRYRTQINLTNKQGKWVTDVWAKENTYTNNPRAEGSFEINGVQYNYYVELAGYYKAAAQARNGAYKMVISYKETSPTQ